MHLLNNLGSKHSMLMEIWQVYIILQKNKNYQEMIWETSPRFFCVCKELGITSVGK